MGERSPGNSSAPPPLKPELGSTNPNVKLEVLKIVYQQLLSLIPTNEANFENQRVVLELFRRYSEQKLNGPNPFSQLIERSLEHYGDPSKLTTLHEQLKQLERGEVPCVIGNLRTKGHELGFMAYRSGKECEIKVINRGAAGLHFPEETFKLNDINNFMRLVVQMYLKELSIGELSGSLGKRINKECPVYKKHKFKIKFQRIGNCYIYSVAAVMDACCRHLGLPHFNAEDRNRAFIEILCDIARKRGCIEDEIEPFKAELQKHFEAYMARKKGQKMAPEQKAKYENFKKAGSLYEKGSKLKLTEKPKTIGAAIETLKEAIALNPHVALFHRDLAVCYRKAGKPQEAEKEEALAASINPNWITLRPDVKGPNRSEDFLKRLARPTIQAEDYIQRGISYSQSFEARVAELKKASPESVGQALSNVMGEMQSAVSTFIEGASRLENRIGTDEGSKLLESLNTIDREFDKIEQIAARERLPINYSQCTLHNILSKVYVSFGVPDKANQHRIHEENLRHILSNPGFQPHPPQPPPPRARELKSPLPRTI